MSTAAIVKEKGESQGSALDDYISKKGISVDKLKEITQHNSNSVPTSAFISIPHPLDSIPASVSRTSNVSPK
jgi:hypothetical protein